MKKINVIISALFFVLIFSCKKEEEVSLGGFAKSGTAIIINEGKYGGNNGSISFLEDGLVTNNIFEGANSGLNVGDVVQYYERVGNSGLIIVNNSKKVLIVDAQSFKLQKTLIEGFTYPRYALSISDKRAYVSNGSGNGSILVVDIDSQKVVKTITVGKGPEMMLRFSTKVYVCNSGGYGNDDSTVSIISTITDNELKKITVGDVPVDMAFDGNGNIWVLCKGVPDFSFEKRLTPAKLVKINTNTEEIEKVFELLPIGSLENVIRIAASNDGNTIYYNKSDGIYALNINSSSLPTSPLIQGFFYGLDVNPDNGEIFGLDAGNFSSNGNIRKYSKSGLKLDSLSVGIAPNNIIFNK
jgi:YVTN family beta-propeller protein